MVRTRYYNHGFAGGDEKEKTMACANFAFLESALERFNMMINMIGAESEHKRMEKASDISPPNEFNSVLIIK